MQTVLKTAGTQFFHSGFALPLQLGIAGVKLNFLWGVVLGGLYCIALAGICLKYVWLVSGEETALRLKFAI